jgi:uncharacterized membrane protein (DUF2068 family)
MPGRATKRIDGLRIIGLLKIGKALLLLATTYGLYRLLNPALVERVQDWLNTLSDTFERRLLERALDWFDSLGSTRVGNILLVTAIYTAVLLTEGIGLWLRKTWAEWMTVIATGSLIPFELYHLFLGHHHRTWAVLGATVLNIAIVIYLVYRLRTGRHAGQRSA